MTSTTQPSRKSPRTAVRAPLHTPAESCVGVVTAVTSQGFRVQSGQLHSAGRRAVSCLLAPAVGDTVACLRVAPNEVWLLAVLAREEGVPNVLQCEGPTRLEVKGGALALAADEMRIDSQQFVLRVDHADLIADEARLMGRQLRVIGTAVKVVGAVLSTVFDRVTHFSKNHLRTTDGVDRVQATHVECEAQQLLRISGEHTIVNGEKLVKARGGQIHFG